MSAPNVVGRAEEETLCGFLPLVVSLRLASPALRSAKGGRVTGPASGKEADSLQDNKTQAMCQQHEISDLWRPTWRADGRRGPLPSHLRGLRPPPCSQPWVWPERRNPLPGPSPRTDNVHPRPRPRAAVSGARRGIKTPGGGTRWGGSRILSAQAPNRILSNGGQAWEIH